MALASPLAEEQHPSAGPPPETDEERPPTARVWTGRVLGPVLALVAYFAIPADQALTEPGRITAAVALLMVVWWMTEAIPLSATALIPIVALPLLGIMDAETAAAPYASPTVFLFMGGFVIALAMQKHHLHMRIALVTMRLVGTHPRRLVLGMMTATAFLSMWVSNTATTMMMLPIGLSVLAMASKGVDGDEQNAAAAKSFGTLLMLAIAFAATIGGLATLIGSPPNLILAGFAEQEYGIAINFVDWMIVGVPLAAVFLFITWLLLTRVCFPVKIDRIAGGRAVITDRLKSLGRMSRGEWIVGAVFAATATLWVGHTFVAESEAIVSALPFVARIDDASIAILAAVALFLIPVDAKRLEFAIDWKTVQNGIPWGVLLLFGGGLSLAAAVKETGLSEYIGTRVEGLGVLPTILIVAGVCAIVLLLTELTSNTATAATFLPVLAGVAIGIGVDPFLLLVPAALAATCSFMLPVGTPPNAIVFATGQISIGQMARTGLWLNLIGIVLITAAVYLIGVPVLGIER
ncbi:DASS family sodium-coupled anion symporter [Glycomyces sp. TRM65418]|uniref:SLC13 family permease n=1 Tax=Glycomyces sp. TRM65418 TaxID=2867006 RepID=UPI001CE4C4B7|nr:DASS family sodium-coupled anion symporter [Glycomyces sp. TRM65418]MCC3762318.1 DASS family sodium-coupled anion symporter [Glycomyces sp. TRM65418]QZD56372.1 DASS family sodium-coupled anion symporter [Glycomyces sp. TRM65418]